MLEEEVGPTGSKKKKATNHKTGSFIITQDTLFVAEKNQAR